MHINILNLSAFRVTAVEEEAHDYHVRVEIVEGPCRYRALAALRARPRAWPARTASSFSA